MPRKPRVFSPDAAYHVIARGNNRAPLFLCEADFQHALALLRFLKTQYVFDLYHYCLMSNHVHFLMRFEDREAFRKVPQRFFLNYAKRFAAKYSHVGHVFQDRFRALPVSNDGYLLECGRYIERNPVSARMVATPAEYRWSSYSFYAAGKPDGLLTRNPTYDDLGRTESERQARYAELIRVDRPYEEIVAAGLYGREWRAAFGCQRR